MKDKEEWLQKYYYIIGVSENEGYDEALEFIVPYFIDQDDRLQIAAIRGIEIIAFRYRDIDKKILNLLFENMHNKYSKMQQETIERLNSIAHIIIRLRKTIYLECFKHNIALDFYRKLKVYTDTGEFKALSTRSEKEEFILSFCQQSSEYEIAARMCIDLLKENLDEKLNIAAILGMNCLLMRFNKIEFDEILPLLIKFLEDEESKSCEYIYAQNLVTNVAYYVLLLNAKCIDLLKKNGLKLHRHL